MDIAHGNAPAFPFVEQHANGTMCTALGLTKYEWLAGMALQGILASGTAKDIANDPEIQKEVGGASQAADLAMSAICGMAKAYANTMIENETENAK